MEHYRLKMGYSGAEHLKRTLEAQRKIDERNPRCRKKTSTEISPLGMSVADVLGLVWRGIYHLDSNLLMKTDWSDNRMIEVRIHGGDLATHDFNELTQLVVVAHDMCLRMSVYPNGPRGMKLSFWQRDGRYRFDEREGYSTRMPTIEDHIAEIRKQYEVIQSEGVPH